MGTVYTASRRPSPILGMLLNVPPWEVPKRGFVYNARTGGITRNWRSYLGGIQTIGGKSPITKTPDNNSLTSIFLATFVDGTEISIICTNQNIYSLTGNVLTKLNANGFTAPPDTSWDMALLLNNAYIGQASDGIQVLGPGGALAPLVASVGQAPHGISLTDFYNHLISAGDINLNPTGFTGSGLGDATNYDIANINGESRMFPIPLKNDPTLCVRKLGDYMMAYKTFSVHAVSYNGGTQFVYSVECIAANTGLVGPRALVAVFAEQGQGDRHFFVGQDNIYVNNGQVNPIGDAVWDDFRARVMPGTFSSIVGWYHELFHEVYFGFASKTGTGAIDTALVYDIDNKCFYYRDWPFLSGAYLPIGAQVIDSWNDETEAWNAGTGRPTQPWAQNLLEVDEAPYVGDAGGNLYLYDATVNEDFTATATTGLDDCGDVMHLKRVGGMRVDIESCIGKTPLELWGRGLMELSDYNTMPYRKLATSTGYSQMFFDITGRWFDWQFIKRDGFCRIGSWEPKFKMLGTR